MKPYDVAIIGSGFASSILARVLRRSGQSVLLLEKGRHPRFSLGESTTPLANLALERLAARYGLEDLHQLSSHGRWSAGLPHLRRGLKRGFSFYKHHPGKPFHNSSANEARLLVAASPNDWSADTHWLRSDVDHHLVERALEEGVDLRQNTEVLTIHRRSGGILLHTTTQGERQSFEAKVLVDGSGSPHLLARSHYSSVATTPGLDTSLLYGHFEGVGSFTERPPLEGHPPPTDPFPEDHAAIHHLLDEGWMYVLPFDHGVASVGLVLRHGSLPKTADPHGDPGNTLSNILQRYPTLSSQFAAARSVTPVGFIPRLPHRLQRAAGRRWFALPHTFTFHDPLFSTGMAWSLLAVERIAQILEGRHGDALKYHQLLTREAAQGSRLVQAAYLAMGDFRLFTAVCALYFITVSYAEAAQRLLDRQEGDPPRAWTGFLGVNELGTRSLYRRTLEALERLPAKGASEQEIEAFTQWLGEEIKPFDLVGFDLPERHNLHPVDLSILLDRSHILGFNRIEMEHALGKLRGQLSGPDPAFLRPRT